MKEDQYPNWEDLSTKIIVSHNGRINYLIWMLKFLSDLPHWDVLVMVRWAWEQILWVLRTTFQTECNLFLVHKRVSFLTKVFKYPNKVSVKVSTVVSPSSELLPYLSSHLCYSTISACRFTYEQEKCRFYLHSVVGNILGYDGQLLYTTWILLTRQQKYGYTSTVVLSYMFFYIFLAIFSVLWKEDIHKPLCTIVRISW